MKKGDAFDQARGVFTAKTMDLNKWEMVTNQIKPNQSQMKTEFSKLLQYCCVTSRVFPGFAPVLSFSNSPRILNVFCSCVDLAERYVSPFHVDVLCHSAHSEMYAKVMDLSMSQTQSKESSQALIVI
jgi:hypothetical protein